MSIETRRFVTAAEKIDFQSPFAFNEWFSRSDIVPNKHLQLVRATMEPGGSHPFHRHPGCEEIIYVISGRAEQWVGRESRELGPGDVAFIPMNEPHATFVPFNEPLVFLAILSPATEFVPETIDISQEEPWRGMRPEREA